MTTDRNGFIGISVSDETISAAQQMRMERDQMYGNIYAEAETDLRWVGEVGEMCFDRWFPQNSSLALDWLLEDTAGKADFVINGRTTVGLKTVKRKFPMLPSYTAQITARHVNEPVDFYFFACYQFPVKCLWLLGGITKTDFLTHAVYYAADEWVHPNYQIRAGHEIYNIEVKHLTPSMEWIGNQNGAAATQAVTEP